MILAGDRTLASRRGDAPPVFCNSRPHAPRQHADGGGRDAGTRRRCWRDDEIVVDAEGHGAC